MTIQGIGSYSDTFSSYRVSRIPEVTTEEVQQQNMSSPAAIGNLSDESLSVQPSPIDEQSKASKIADLENVSLTFNKEDDFDYIGRDSDLSGLDMEAAISDMRKDQVLEEYQTFVGSSALNLQKMSQDGIVIPKMGQ